MKNGIDIKVACPNCGEVNNAIVRKYGGVVASIEECYLCEGNYIVVIRWGW